MLVLMVGIRAGLLFPAFRYLCNNSRYSGTPVTSISSDKHLRPGFLREAKHLRPGFLGEMLNPGR
jgi:hypothetical protein